jgi:hypothetical protein
MNIDESKLQDYIAGLKELQSTAFPIGVIIADDDTSDNQSSHETITYLKTEGIDTIEAVGHEDLILENLLKILSKGEPVALHIDTAVSTRVLDGLRDAAFFDRLRVVVPGERDVRVLSPLPEGAFLLLIMDSTTYREAQLGEVISSACNLVAE